MLIFINKYNKTTKKLLILFINYLLLNTIKICKILDMEKPSASLEITSKSIKIVIGYVIDDQVCVLYAMNKPIGPYIENGTIVNFPSLIDEMKKVAFISDPNAKLKIKISDVLLCLPPCGLEIFQTKQVTTVVSDESKVSPIDIKNIYALISKERIPSNNEFIDVIPEQFILDQDKVFSTAPIGEISNTVTIKAKVHTLPRHVCSDYSNLVKSAGINVRRTIIAPFGVVELLGSYNDIPNDYFLVDIGAKMTSVSLVGQKQLYGTTFFAWGGDNITDKITEQFQINHSDAEKYKIMYGYDNRKMNFEPLVCSVIDEEGNNKKYTVSELSKIIKSELDNLIEKLNYAIGDLLKGYDSSYQTLPMVIVGGGSQLKGLKTYLEPKISSDVVIIAKPKTLGARNPSFFNCLGMLKAAHKYQNGFEDSLPKISPINRVSK